jgi:hypothetical protein
MIFNDEWVALIVASRLSASALQHKFKPGGRWEKALVVASLVCVVGTGLLLLTRHSAWLWQ